MNKPLKTKILQNPAKYTAGLVLAGWGLTWVSRTIFKKAFGSAVSELMTNKYHKNLWELVSAATKVGPQTIVETSMRAEYGVSPNRPLGTPRKLPNFDNLMFNFAQLNEFPIPLNVPVDTKTVIGPRAKRPLVLETPIIIGGMAYGLALSERAKIGLALGASLANTATNTGEGPFLASERKAAKKLILQYNRGSWSKSPDIIKQADMIEIQLGQGAMGGSGHVMKSQEIDLKLRWQLGLMPGEDAVSHAILPGMSHPRDLRKIVDHLRRTSNGVPIAVKLAAGKNLELDLDWVLESGVDAIAVGTAQGGTKGTPPILQDDFGLPNIYALCRTTNHLIKRGMKNRVSLILAGGLYTPGHFLKALALGADAVYIGSIALFAMSHTTVLNALPFEPPTQVVWYDGEFQNKLNPRKAGRYLGEFINACTQEMSEGARALGKKSIHKVDLSDLFALDEVTAQLVGVPLASEPAIDQDYY